MSLPSLRPLSIPVVASFALTACFDDGNATSADASDGNDGGPLTRPDTGDDGTRDTGNNADDAGQGDGGRPGLDAGPGDDATTDDSTSDGSTADGGGGSDSGGGATVVERALAVVRDHAGVMCRGLEGCDPYGFAFAYDSVDACIEAFYDANSAIFSDADEACLDGLESYVECSTANVSCELDYYTFSYRFGLAEGECVDEFDAFSAACNLGS